MKTRLPVQFLAHALAAVGILTFGFFTFGIASAADPKPPVKQEVKPEVAATIRQAIESRYPGTKVLDVQVSPVAGVYEIYSGDQIVYADATGDHLIVGNMVDSRTHTDLTGQQMERRSKIDFKSLPFDKAIKIVKGNGSRQIAVFEDPDCPFCQRLEKELLPLTDVTEYVFLYPIDSLHPQATPHAHAIWCAPDRAKAWTDWLLQKKAPPAASCKSDPVSELAKLGDKLHINGTPTMYFADGGRVVGAVKGAELQERFAAVSGTTGATPATPAGPPGSNSSSKPANR